MGNAGHLGTNPALHQTGLKEDPTCRHCGQDKTWNTYFASVTRLEVQEENQTGRDDPQR